MRLLDSLRARIATLFQRSQMNAEIEEELRAHIQLRADDLERSGLDRAEAERRASIEFGGQVRYAEESQEAMGSNFFETLIQDVRVSLRKLRKSPSFAVVAVFTLALAIGANALVFSVTNAFLLHPLHLPQEESLFAVWRANSTATESYPDYLDLRDRNRSFESLAGFDITEAGLDTGASPSRAWLYEVTGNYFDTLGIQPYLGRLFHGSDERGSNSAPFVVLSHACWHNRFQDDRSVVGRTVLVNKHPFTVVGVAPPEFHGSMVFFHPDFYVPIVNQEQVDGSNKLNARNAHGAIFMAMGHLKAGVTAAEAIADLNSIGADLEKNYPKDDGNMKFSLTRPGFYGDYLGSPVKAFLGGLMLLAGSILLAACANLGGLFAARASDRAREVALRLALGASRGRILRQLFTEALLIALMGGALGLWGSILLLRLLSVWQPFPEFPIHVAVTPDATVYAVALLLSLASGLLFGAVPVRQILRADPYLIIKSGSTNTLTRRMTIRDLLLAGQIAICAVLVTSSLVAVRGLVRSMNSNFGFEPRNALLAGTELAMGGYTAEKQGAVQKRMIEALESIPGVEAVGLSDWTPMGVNADSMDSRVYTDRTADLRPGNAAMIADIFKISPGYFRAAGTSMVLGRTLTWHDDPGAPRIAVVNREFAQRIFGSVSGALGGFFKLPDGARIQVVGIAENGKYDHLTEDPKPTMFLPVLQSPSSQSWFVVRSSRDPQQLAGDVRSALRSVDAALPYEIGTWHQKLEFAFFPPRVATASLGVLGAMGALLSVTGIFGLAAYSVSKRKKELGIRIALGAQRKEVLQAALGRAVKLLAFGSAAGLALGILASRVLSFIVFQATPRDPLVLAGSVLAMALLGLLATWIPAQRALSLDPLMLLREE